MRVTMVSQMDQSSLQTFNELCRFRLHGVKVCQLMSGPVLGWSFLQFDRRMYLAAGGSAFRRTPHSAFITKNFAAAGWYLTRMLAERGRFARASARRTAV
jgi:hypothetical protein